MKSGRTKNTFTRDSRNEFQRKHVNLEFHEDFDVDSVVLETDAEVTSDVARSIAEDIERSIEAEFFGMSARGRDEYFDGQFRIKLVD